MVIAARPESNVNPVSLPLTNAQIAERITEAAELLEQKNANPFRVRAYRRAADTIRDRTESVAEIVQTNGPSALTDWPGIGKSIAHAIELLCRTDDWPLLNSLRGKADHDAVLATVAGVGPKLAARIRGSFGIETLPDLETAAYDGRLATLPGIGQKRLRAIRESLAGRFQKGGRAAAFSPTTSHEPSVDDLLSIDEEYRLKADNGRLVQVAPLRFNPTGAMWRPILHTRRNDRGYTALYSNSPLANQWGTTHDWVVIYRGRPDPGQWTIVTGRRGALKGRRVIRGREIECEAYYARTSEREESS